MIATLPVTELTVSLDFGTSCMDVGRLVLHEGTIYFSYDEDFLSTNLEISPLKLPLQSGVNTFINEPFAGLPGVFDDSLPDGWGRLLFDRFLLQQNIHPQQVTALDRLAHVGNTGIGALCYKPELASEESRANYSLDTLATTALKVLDDSPTELLETLLRLAGSSAGARPKAIIDLSPDRSQLHYSIASLPREGLEPWLVKFPNTTDGMDAGVVEYVYALMAKNAGVAMEAVHLFESNMGPGFFATRRFDRSGPLRYHMHTASGLLHADFRTPALDYRDLLALTMTLTQDIREVEKVYRLAVFNVIAHNRDDHGKNFSFLMDSSGTWRFAPAYDLTFSYGPSGEQSTMVLGEGADPTIKDLQALGNLAKLPKATIAQILEKTKEAVAQWPHLAREYGVYTETRNTIAAVLDRTCN